MPITTPNPESVIVHPLVLLSVVDHYNRVARNTKKRVVGVLLGQNNGKTVNVANSYALPFEEDEKDPSVWFLDHNYHEAMYDMFKKVNAKEKIVGWYHSGPKLRSSDLEINDLFRRYIPNPVLVIIDVHPKDVGIPTDSYYAIEEIHDDGTATTRTFTHLPTSIEAEEAEEIGVEHLLRDIKDNAVSTLSTQVTQQLQSLKGLQSRLSEISEYLGKVVSNELPVNHHILANLQNIFNLLPNMSDVDVQKAFANKTNDELLVIYLGAMIRSVIRLHELIDNVAENRRRELEGSSEKKEEVKDGKKEDKVADKEAVKVNKADAKK